VFEPAAPAETSPVPGARRAQDNSKKRPTVEQG
jgi:hypothetical protein